LIWSCQTIIASTANICFQFSILQGTLPYYFNLYSQQSWKEGKKHVIFSISNPWKRKLRLREVKCLAHKQLMCCRNWSPVPFYYQIQPSKDQEQATRSRNKGNMVWWTLGRVCVIMSTGYYIRLMNHRPVPLKQIIHYMLIKKQETKEIQGT